MDHTFSLHIHCQKSALCQETSAALIRVKMKCQYLMLDKIVYDTVAIRVRFVLDSTSQL